jgi:tetratricopeptide (TPR) repeat protein
MNDWAGTVAARLGDGGPDPSGNDEQMLFRRAVASYLLEDYGAALESLRRLANQSTNPRWLLNLGFMLCQQRRYRDALSAFAAAVESDPFHLRRPS